MRRDTVSMPRKLGALVMAMGLAASLGVTTTATAAAQDPYTMATPAAGENHPALQKFYAQRVQWGPCLDAAMRSSTLDRYQAFLNMGEMECGTVEVPVVYPDVIAQDKALGNPWKVEPGKTAVAKIAVSRVKATGKRWGGMLINPGGPGGSGLNMSASLASPAAAAKILEHFDLVGFDPRGLGASEPNLKCISDKAFDNKRTFGDAAYTRKAVVYQNQQNRHYMNGCIKDVGATFLAHIGTRDVVRDMDVIRAAIGDKKLTYIGYSYGTFLGSQYAEAFPTKLRALVLDGVVDPTEDSVESVVNQGAGFQKSFEAWAKWCAKERDCPLGNDPSKATSEFHKLVWPLQKKPAPTIVMSRSLSWSDSVQAVIASLYTQATWPLLKLGLQQLKTGAGGDVLLALADGYYGRWIDGTYANTQDVFQAVLCMDNESNSDHAKQLNMMRRYMKAMKFADPGGAIENVPADLCSIWPARHTIRPHKPSVHSNGNILVVSTTGDPATPYEAGVQLARDMKAPLVTYVGEGHCAALRGQACVDRYVGDFIVNKRIHKSHVTCRSQP